jgi:hypothetical protein
MQPIEAGRGVEGAEEPGGGLVVARGHGPVLLQPAPEVLDPVPAGVGGRVVRRRGLVHRAGRHARLGAGGADPRAQASRARRRRNSRGRTRPGPRGRAPGRRRAGPGRRRAGPGRRRAGPGRRRAGPGRRSARSPGRAGGGRRLRARARRRTRGPWCPSRRVSGRARARRPPLAPAAERWARTLLPSRKTSAKSGRPASRRAASRRCQEPSRDQRQWSCAARHQGPSSAAMARHLAPLRVRQTTASTVRRAAANGGPPRVPSPRERGFQRRPLRIREDGHAVRLRQPPPPKPPRPRRLPNRA